MKERKHQTPSDIERTSISIILGELSRRGISIPEEHLPAVTRAIHATADFDYAENLVFEQDAIRRGLAALQGGVSIVTDSNMAKAGISRPAMEKLGVTAICLMAEQSIAEAAKSAGTTRAAAAVCRTARELPDAVYAVGNAPTALLQLVEEITERGLRPPLVIAAPVGFVNVVESKEELKMTCRTYGIPFIGAMGNKGGSTVAAALCNALLYQAADMLKPEKRGWN